MAQNPGQVNQPGLDTYDKGLDLATKEFSQRLRRWGAREGAERLEWIRQEFHRFSIEEAYQVLRPGEIADELVNIRLGSRLNTALHITRNVFSVAPIILTWLALCLAAIFYQQDLSNPKHAGDLYLPFLELWQDGFHSLDPFPFSRTAFIDVIILSVLIILVLLIPLREQRIIRKVQKDLQELHPVIKRILFAIGRAGVHTTLADQDIAKITQAIERTFDRVLLRHDQLVEEARDFVKDTKQEMQTVSGEFRRDLATFNNNVRTLESGLKNLGNNLNSYDQKLKDLTDASTRLAGSSLDLAKNAGDMAVSANQSAQASQGISTQLSSLNVTQQDIVKTQQQVATTIQQTQSDVVKEISQTQKDVVKEIAGVADDIEASSKDTRDAAKELERVATNLGQITQADLQQMTNQVTNIVNLVANAAGSLVQVNAQLQGTTQALNDAAQALAQGLGVKPPRRWRFPFF